MINKLKERRLELGSRLMDVDNLSGLSIGKIWNLENSLAYQAEDETKQKLAKYLEPRIEKILGKV